MIRNLFRLQKVREERRLSQLYSEDRSAKPTRNSRSAIVELDAPIIFGLSEVDSHRSIVRFIKKLKCITLIDGEIAFINFRPTMRLYADGVLLFYAELKRILRRKPYSVRCCLSATQLVNETFKHLKIFDLIGCKCPVRPSHDTVVSWTVIEGIETDAREIGRQIDQHSARSPKLAQTLFEGASEALSNVPQHAYYRQRNDGTGVANEAGWWAFSRELTDENSVRKLLICICDLGLGIPETLDERVKSQDRDALAKAKEFVLGILGVPEHHDGTLIASAVESRISRTGDEWRGRGLGTLRSVIDILGQGTMRIMSNAGGYYYGKSKEEKVTGPLITLYDESIFGTLVYWSVPLDRLRTA